jgi:hypothetical protein
MSTNFSFFSRRASTGTRGNAGCTRDPGFSISPDARASVQTDGVVFLQLGSGSVFRSNRIGARIWRGLLEREEMDSIAARISHEYAVPREQVDQDAAGFIADLEKQGLLARDAGGR